MSLVSLHPIVVHTHQVWRIIRPVSAVVWNVVPSLILHVCILFSHVLSIVWVVLRMLLTVNQGHTIYIVVLVIVIFVSSHDQVLFCSLEANTTYHLSSFACNIDICHIIVLVTSLSLIIRVHCWKHSIMDLWRIIHVHFALIPLSLSFMNGRLSFHGSVVVAGKLCLARVLSQLVHLCIIIIITLLVLFPFLKILFGCVVTQQLLLFLVIFVLDCRGPN